jgi:hypothetical protein
MSNEINLLQILYRHLEYLLFLFMKVKIIKFINGPKFSFFYILHIVIRHLVLVTLEHFININS